MTNEDVLQRPTYGCQIMVQSEEEKRLRKQIRKEEKKINKIMSNVEGGDDEDEEDFQFDPIDLRTKRQAALANAMSQPMFKEASEKNQAAAVAATEQYPFVFDSQNAAKSTAGNYILNYYGAKFFFKMF